MKVCIFHGAESSPEENWFPWLKDGLKSRNHRVCVPEFPTPEGQTLENWIERLANCGCEVDEDSVLVGHSTGAAFILNVLERIDTPVHASFFVAGFSELLGNRFDALNESFVDKEFDWDAIRKNCGDCFVFHGDDDPYVSLSTARTLGNELETDVTVLSEAGHINAASGYTSFETLLEKIEEVV